MITLRYLKPEKTYLKDLFSFHDNDIHFSTNWKFAIYVSMTIPKRFASWYRTRIDHFSNDLENDSANFAKDSTKISENDSNHINSERPLTNILWTTKSTLKCVNSSLKKNFLKSELSKLNPPFQLLSYLVQKVE